MMNVIVYVQKNRYMEMNEGDKIVIVIEVFNIFGGFKKDLYVKMFKNRLLYVKYWELLEEGRNDYVYVNKKIYVMVQVVVINVWINLDDDIIGGVIGWYGCDVLSLMFEIGYVYEDFQFIYGFKWVDNVKIGVGVKIIKKNMLDYLGENG